MERLSVVTVGKINIVNMVTPAKAMYRLNEVPIKTWPSFIEIEKNPQTTKDPR